MSWRRMTLSSRGSRIIAPLWQMIGAVTPSRPAVAFASRYQRDVAKTTCTPAATASRTAAALASLIALPRVSSVPSRSSATSRTRGAPAGRGSPAVALPAIGRESQAQPPHAHVRPAADHQVVEQLDVHQLRRLGEAARHADVVRRRLRVARGVV